MSILYYVGAGAAPNLASSWAASSGGAGGAGTPDNTKDLRVDANSGASFPLNVSIGALSLNFTGFTGTWSGATALSLGGTIAGDSNQVLTLGSGMTVTYTGNVLFNGTYTGAPQLIASNGKTTPASFFFQQTGSNKFADAFSNTGVSGISCGNGSVDLNAQSITTTTFSSTGTNTRSINFGACTITTTAAAGWNISGSGLSVTNLTASTINVQSATTATFGGAGLAYGTVNLQALANCSVTGTNSYTNLSRSAASGKLGQLTLTAGTTQTVSGTYSANGVDQTSPILVRSGNFLSPATISAGTVSSNFCHYEDITGTGAGNWNLSGGLTGDCGGNTGITFTAPSTQTMTGTTTTATWSDATKWSGHIPLPQDSAVSAIAWNTANPTVTLDMPRAAKSIDFTGTTWNANPLSFIKTTNTTVYGNVTLVSGMTNIGSTNFTVESRSAAPITIDTKGAAFSNPVVQGIAGMTVIVGNKISGGRRGVRNGGEL